MSGSTPSTTTNPLPPPLNRYTTSPVLQHELAVRNPPPFTLLRAHPYFPFRSYGYALNFPRYKLAATHANFHANVPPPRLSDLWLHVNVEYVQSISTKRLINVLDKFRQINCRNLYKFNPSFKTC